MEAVRRGLKNIQEEFGDSVEVIGVGTTGSGRHMIGRFVGADVIRDEITSQARAAVHLDPRVDTIFEIGGQDSKYIALEEGGVTDFQMNKVCAAGTGSFIEEQAKKFNIPVQDLGPIALRGSHPISLGERCTVFMETGIAAHLARGASMEDMASGICYSIVKNHLNRVVGQKKIGEHPNMYWPFGQHILEPARLLASRPNLYAILLTHHGCGPDSVLSHYFKELMGGKSYLNIEVDEHSSDVGVITRLEAFINSLRGQEITGKEGLKKELPQQVRREVNIKTRLEALTSGSLLYLPNLYPYAQIFQTMLSLKGINAGVLLETNSRSVELGRRHTLTNEYFSLTALLGDILRELEGETLPGDGTAFLIPQTEGAEIDGQFHRFVRTKLDQAGYGAVDIFAPFLEDVVCGSKEDLKALFLGLLAGDIILAARLEHREGHLKGFLRILETRFLEFEDLQEMARKIAGEAQEKKVEKTFLVIGEPLIVYNDFMNDFCFREIEEQKNRVFYSPLSEALYVFWCDFLNQNENQREGETRGRLDTLKDMIADLSECLSDKSPFERDPDTFPVAVRLLGGEGDIPEGARNPSKDLNVKIAHCQAAAVARRYGWTLAMTPDDLGCAISGHTYGWKPADQEEAADFFTRMNYADDRAAALNIVASLRTLEPG